MGRKLRVNPQWHFLALLAAGVVFALRGQAILEHRAWSQGTASVMGRIEEVEASRRIRVVRYSYEVEGKRYEDEVVARDGFLPGMPANVTYAKSDPRVSALRPEEYEGIYRTSLWVVGAAALPMAAMWGVELAGLFRRRPPAA
jgi:hypothetical protein